MPSDHRDLPPGPRMPRALQTVFWFRRAQWMLRTCAARFGDTFTLRIAGEGEWVVTSDPNAIREVFTGDPRILHAGEGNRILLPVLGPSSVLLLDDDAHLHQRRLMLPAFHGERMKAYGTLMRELAAEEVESWPVGSRVALRPRMQAVTLEIILRAVFGVADGPRHDGLRTALRDLLAMGTSVSAGLALIVLGPDRAHLYPPLRRCLRRVDALIAEEIAERRGVADLAERADVLSLLLQATDEDGRPMTDAELRDELVTLLVAGHETTANSLAWAVERLCRHPEKLDRLVREMQAGETAYLQAVVQETLRLRPVISIVVRRLTEPMRIGGRMLPAGAAIVPSIHLVHRRGDVYPDPDAFRPERFLESPPGTYTWIPFGGGVRRCLGAAFAQFEMEAVLREMVLRRSFAPVRPEDERVVRRAITETPGRDGEVLVGPAPAPAMQADAPAPPLAQV